MIADVFRYAPLITLAVTAAFMPCRYDALRHLMLPPMTPPLMPPLSPAIDDADGQHARRERATRMRDARAMLHYVMRVLY